METRDKGNVGGGGREFLVDTIDASFDWPVELMEDFSPCNCFKSNWLDGVLLSEPEFWVVVGVERRVVCFVHMYGSDQHGSDEVPSLHAEASQRHALRQLKSGL